MSSLRQPSTVSNEAEILFGETILSVTKESIPVTNNNKPAMLMSSTSEHENIQKLKNEYVQREVQQGLLDVKNGHVIDAEKTFTSLRDKLSKMNG